ncbi:N-acetylglucosamine kinase [Pseudoroseicyclus sp. H15]
MSLILGIDSGGTKTLALAVDHDGKVVRASTGPGLDPTGSAAPEAELRAALSAIRAQTGEVEAATLGLAYHTELAEISRMQSAVAAEVLGGGARVLNDVDIAHRGVFQGQEGILCLAGTGSMAWAVGPNGTARAGGFGPLIGDEGSAYDIGRRALQLLSHEADGRRPASPFGATLSSALGIPPEGLIDWIYTHPSPRAGVADVARTVSALAAEGDAQAQTLLTGAAAELAAAARAAAGQAGLGQGAPWATGGSVFRDAVFSQALTEHMGSAPKQGGLPPVGGALIDAAKRAGWPVTPDFTGRLGAAIQTHLSKKHQDTR